MRRLLSYLRPYRGRVVLALLLSFLVAGLTSLSLSSLIPFLDMLFEEGGLESFRSLAGREIARVSEGLAAWTVEELLATRMAALATLVVLVFVLTVAKGVLRFLNGYLVGTTAIAAARDLTNELYGHLIRQPVLAIEREGVGNLSSRFTADSDEVVRALKTLTGTIFREPLQFLFLLALALLISPTLTLAALVIFPLVGLLIRKAGRVAKSNARRVLAHRSRLLSILQETFLGIRVVQSCRGEGRSLERFAEENRRLYDRNRRLVRVEALTPPAMEVLVVLGVGGALLLGGAMAIRGDIAPSLVVVLYIAVGALYEPVRKLASCVPRIQAGLAGAVRIFEYLDRRSAVVESPGATPLADGEHGIRLEGVTCSYGGSVDALREVDLEIEAGSWFAVVGPSGSGKSTLAGLLPRFFDPEGGTVRFDGRDVRELTLDSLRSQVMLVPQETFLLDDSLRANIAFARPGASETEVRRAARIAHVEDFASKLPEGLGTRVGERGTTLSGGQRQRIAIARAILARPRVLVLDEAVSQVDEESALLIRDALLATREGRTTVVITHRVDTLLDAERIAVLREGRLEAVAPPADLLSSSATYRDLVDAAAAARAART
jgi:subfamily B ATP-binding cassette protein MsbA